MLLAISIVLSSLPLHVSALQYSSKDITERVSTSVENEELERTQIEVPDTTIDEEEPSDAISDTTSINFLEESTLEPFLESDQTAESQIIIPDGQCLILGEDRRFTLTEGSSTILPSDIDEDTYGGYYDENTTIVVAEKAFIGTTPGLASPVSIGNIEEQSVKNTSLQILQGSNIHINSMYKPGIAVVTLLIGSMEEHAVRTNIKITTNTSGIMASDISVYDTDLSIVSDEFLDTRINPTIRSKRMYSPGLRATDFELYDAKVYIVTENGMGVVADSMVIDKDSSLIATAMKGDYERGILVARLKNAGALTGIAMEGNVGIAVMESLVMESADINTFPSLIGEAKTGCGILIELKEDVLSFSMDSGVIVGKVGDGIGLQFRGIELGDGGTYLGDKKIIGIAEKGYGIYAESIKINDTGWEIKGESKGVLETAMFDQTWIPTAAGILVTNILHNGEFIYLNSLGGGITIEGYAPTDIAGSCGIFVHAQDSHESSTGEIDLNSSAGDIVVKAIGHTGVYTSNLAISEYAFGGINNLTYLTVNGELDGVVTGHLTIYGARGDDDLNDYRIKVTGKYGNGLSIIANESNFQTMYLESARIEATGDVYGIYAKNKWSIHIADSIISATGVGENSVAGIYMDAQVYAQPTPSSLATTLNLQNSYVVAESETYGWYCHNYMVIVSAYPNSMGSSSTYIEALGAEVGMKVGIDQDLYQLSMPLIILVGDEFRDSVVLRAAAKQIPPDRAMKSALNYDKVVVDDPDDTINRGVLVKSATLIEEYRTSAEQKIGTTPIWAYAKGLNMDKILNYTWVLDQSDILINKTAEGITSKQGTGEASLEVSRKGDEGELEFLNEPVVLNDGAAIGGLSEVEPALHTIIFKANFGPTENGGGGSGGIGTTSTEPENPSTEATTSSEIGPEASTEGSTDVDENEAGATTKGSNGGGNNDNGNGNPSKGNGNKPVVPWKNGRPNTGDMSGQYVISAFVLLSIISGAYVYMTYRKKNRID